MKIVKVDIILMEIAPKDNLPWGPILCRVYTDNGLYGDGEAAIAYGIGKNASYGMIKDLSKLIIGMNPLDNEVIWEKLYKATFWGQNGGPIFFSGLSAIDIALWDIKGKYYNAPVYQLLGGAMRKKLRCYASQLQFGWDDKKIPAYSIDDYVNNCKKALSEGYDAIKIDFFTFSDENYRFDHEKTFYRITPKEENLIVDRVKAVRETIGPNVDLIMENHSNLDLTTAKKLADRLKPYNIKYLEEATTPFTKINKHLSDHVDIPIAHGERIYTRWGYAPYFEDRSIDMIQVDIGNTGGLTEAKKICDMAYVYDVGVQAHVCASPLSTAVALQLEAVIPNFVIHEHHVYNRYDYNKKMAKKNIEPVNGYLTIPEEPGLGNEISDYCFETGKVITVE